MTPRWRRTWAETATRTRAPIDVLPGKTYVALVNDVTRLSAKGQIVIPKDVRDRLGWVQGKDLEVVPVGDGVMLRPLSQKPRLTIDQATEELRQIYRHEGPPIPIERLSWSADIEDPEMDREFRR